jgi:hypothetical protein
VTLFSTRLIPYLSRMTSETEGVATGNDRKLKPQVSAPFPPPAQVTVSAGTTLSRWRHWFEPRWDYEHKGPGQGTSMKAFGRLNRDSNAEYPERNILSRIERSEVRESPRVEGGCTGATASWHPHHCAVHGRTSGHRIGTSWSSVPRPSRSLRRRPPRSVCPLSVQGGADRGVDVWFWCDQTGEFGVQVNRGPIAETLVDGLCSGASGAECSESDAARQRTRIHVLFYLVEHDPQT